VQANPLKHPDLQSLRDKLAAEPGSKEIIKAIRQKDLALRREFFRTGKMIEIGAWLLLVGAGLFIGSAVLAVSARKTPPVPSAPATEGSPDIRMGVFGRLAVAVVSVALVATAFAVPILTREKSGRSQARGVWPRFRGPGGSGISQYTNVPLEFDVPKGRNIAWKTVVPLSGMSSPAVWDDRVFLTGANKMIREVFCFDALSGKITWRKSITAGPNSTKIPENVMEETSYAAPTPVIDVENGRVYVMFANGDVACLNMFGKQIWARNLGTPDNMYGHAASPLLWKDRLVVQIDQGDEDDDTSVLIALDAKTGKDIWRTVRPVGSSWPTPIVAPVPKGDQIIACANPWVIAYNPVDGKELWRVDCLEGDGGPSPIFVNGLVLAANVGSKIAAIKPDGKGDVTKTHVAWEFDEDIPDTCSPLSDGKLLWMVSETMVTCLDVKTGKRMWNKDYDTSFYSSPALVGDRVYLISRKGKVFVISSGKKFEELARGDLGEECDTCPAFAEGRIYIRAKTHLICIEEWSE